MPSGHETTTKGGLLAHWLRRLVHVGMILVPWFYYTFHVPLVVLWVLLLIIIIIEIFRLSFGIQFFGQRLHETQRISSFAWGAVSLFLVLLLAQPQFAYPIIAGCALGDPLVGELRRFRLSPLLIALIGSLFIAGIWLFAWFWLGTASWWWAIIMGPLTTAVEWPNLKWIDDNATTQLVPLIIVWLWSMFC